MTGRQIAALALAVTLSLLVSFAGVIGWIAVKARTAARNARSLDNAQVENRRRIAELETENRKSDHADQQAIDNIPSNEPRQIIASLSADELIKQWHDNAALFAKNYDGQWVEVFGEVDRVTEGFNRSKNKVFGVKEAELKFRYTTGAGSLYCFFLNADELLILKPKDTIRVIGRVYCGEILSLHLVDTRLNVQAENHQR